MPDGTVQFQRGGGGFGDGGAVGGVEGDWDLFGSEAVSGPEPGESVGDGNNMAGCTSRDKLFLTLF